MTEFYSQAIYALKTVIDMPSISQVTKLSELIARHPGAEIRVVRIKHQGGQDWGSRIGRRGLCARVGRSSKMNYEIWALLPGCLEPKGAGAGK